VHIAGIGIVGPSIRGQKRQMVRQNSWLRAQNVLSSVSHSTIERGYLKDNYRDTNLNTSGPWLRTIFQEYDMQWGNYSTVLNHV
jgi:hypothetical protein